MVYPAQDAAGGSPRDVAVAFTSYPAWRWSIVGGSYLEEFTRDSVVVRNWCVAAALGVVALLVGLLALLARRWISRPLAAAIQATDRIAAGDLTATIAIDSRDEVGRLLAAMHKMQTVLTGTVRGIQQAAHHVDARAGEIAGGSSDLASRTDEQAASLEETAANVEEISASMKQNADGALRAQRLASEASEAARRGGEMSARVAATMESIEASSRKITEIVSVIDGIAFQTNILALNAAVEAARAGEHGRGFAVVATEVRSLAQRSAEAAREIDALITDSTARVRAGSALVHDSNQANETILAAVARVADVVEHISRTTGEQSLGIDEIRSAMTQLEQVTSQNATLVRETADAAASLEEQASELSTSAASFRVSGEPTADAPPAGRADRAGSQPLASASLSPRGSDRARGHFPHGRDHASDSDRASPSLGA
jgi:methyl-accepting chemotaxis protein